MSLYYASLNSRSFQLLRENPGQRVRVFLGRPGVTLLPEGGGRYDFSQAAQLAAEYMSGILVEAKKRHTSRA